MIQLHQRPLLDPRLVAARDAELARDLPLRALVAAAVQAEPPADHLLLALVENVEIAVNFAFLDLELYLVFHFVGLGAQYILQRNLVAFFVRSGAST